jgi:hypothetical protein
MLRACCECVTKMLRTRLLATFNIRSLSSLLPHVATILRSCCDPCCVQHPTSGASSPFSSTQHPTPRVCNIETQRLQHWKIMFATPNSTCLQHRDSTSATSKINGCNIQHQGPHWDWYCSCQIYLNEKNLVATLRHVACNTKKNYDIESCCM